MFSYHIWAFCCISTTSPTGKLNCYNWLSMIVATTSYQQLCLLIIHLKRIANYCIVTLYCCYELKTFSSTSKRMLQYILSPRGSKTVSCETEEYSVYFPNYLLLAMLVYSWFCWLYFLSCNSIINGTFAI